MNKGLSYMVIKAAELQVGDVIQDSRASRTKVETIRRGGHTPYRYKTKDGPTIPIDVSSTPERLLEGADVIVNEQWVYQWSANVTVVRGEKTASKK